MEQQTVKHTRAVFILIAKKYADIKTNFRQRNHRNIGYYFKEYEIHSLGFLILIMNLYRGYLHNKNNGK